MSLVMSMARLLTFGILLHYGLDCRYSSTQYSFQWEGGIKVTILQKYGHHQRGCQQVPALIFPCNEEKSSINFLFALGGQKETFR